MAKLTTSGVRAAVLAGAETSRPELTALLPLVRLLAQEAAREAWSVRDEKDQTHDDLLNFPALP